MRVDCGKTAWALPRTMDALRQTCLTRGPFKSSRCLRVRSEEGGLLVDFEVLLIESPELLLKRFLLVRLFLVKIFPFFRGDFLFRIIFISKFKYFAKIKYCFF